MSVLVILAVALAAFPALMFLRNVRLFRRPSAPLSPGGEGQGVRGPLHTSPLEGEVGETQSSREGGSSHHPPPATTCGRDDLPLKGGGQESNPLTPSPSPPGEKGARVSVLIPARNEEAGIAACVRSVLASVGVEVEVIVLDDSSADRTAAIVRELAASDPRVRLETAPALPSGWCGKQHACFTLSKLATHEVITFIDADVRLEPEALANMVGFLHSSNAALVSGFPRQETGTLLEKLVIPLIHWLLVCYLPFDRMRKDLQPGLGAGCGQWFLTTKAAYEQVGGHSHPLVKESLHDGIKLPRAYRTCGLMTDTADATHDATCRMYRSAGQVWNGFAKNAREGLGAPVLIWVWTVLLAGGHLLQWVLLAFTPWMQIWQVAVVGVACGLSLLPRLACAARYWQSWFGAVLHPFGVLLMLAIQWYATVRKWVGRPVGWKGRAHPSRAV